MQERTEWSKGARGRMLGWLFIFSVGIVLLVNVPIDYDGLGLVQRIPAATSVVLYEGMLLQGSGSEIYLLADHQLRPFDSPETYRHFRNREHRVAHRVSDQLIAQFRRGQPIRRLVTCRGADQVYLVEKGVRRQVRTLPPGLSNRWDRIETLTCSEIDQLPLGLPLLGFEVADRK